MPYTVRYTDGSSERSGSASRAASGRRRRRHAARADADAQEGQQLLRVRQRHPDLGGTAMRVLIAALLVLAVAAPAARADTQYGGATLPANNRGSALISLVRHDDGSVVARLSVTYTCGKQSAPALIVRLKGTTDGQSVALSGKSRFGRKRMRLSLTAPSPLTPSTARRSTACRAATYTRPFAAGRERARRSDGAARARDAAVRADRPVRGRDAAVGDVARTPQGGYAGGRPTCAAAASRSTTRWPTSRRRVRSRPTAVRRQRDLHRALHRPHAALPRDLRGPPAGRRRDRDAEGVDAVPRWESRSRPLRERQQTWSARP